MNVSEWMCLTSWLFKSTGGYAKKGWVQILVRQWSYHQYLMITELCAVTISLCWQRSSVIASVLWSAQASPGSFSEWVSQPMLELFCLLLLQMWDDVLFPDQTPSFSSKILLDQGLCFILCWHFKCSCRAEQEQAPGQRSYQSQTRKLRGSN